MNMSMPDAILFIRFYNNRAYNTSTQSSYEADHENSECEQFKE
jgi:hypothetical protein